MSYYMTVGTAILSIPFMYLFYRKDKKWRIAMGEEITYRHASLLEYVLVCLIAFGACIGGNNLIMASGLITVDSTYQEVSELLYSASLPVQIIGTAMIVPLCEELLFRGLLYNRLKEKIPANTAIWLSALAFGVYHGNLVQLVYATLLGVLMAYLYEKYHSFLAPYLFHATANLVSVLITETTWFDFMYKNKLMMLVSGVVGLIIVAYGLYVVSTTVNLEPEDPESKVQVEL
jgi:membrane protease YdiL (CAAX protease family)